MRVFLVIVGIHAAIVGFAFLFAGFMSLAVPTEAEEAATRERFEAERRKGFWRYAGFCFRQTGSARSRDLSLAISHWPERPESRRMIYIGGVGLVVAVVIGWHLGVFNS